MSVFKVSSNKSSVNNFPSVRPTLDLDFANSKTLDPRITFTRASGGSYVGADGLIKLAGVNEPRFDHNPATGESLGLLVEEDRTNLRTYSAAPNTSNDYRIYGTPTYNTGVAPDGTATTTLIVGSGAAFQGFDNYPNDYGNNQNAIQTYSVYVKNVNATSVRITLISNVRYTFTFATESGVAEGGASGGFQKLSGGWYRIWMTATKSNRFWFQQVYIDSGNSTSSSAYFWGVQLEAGSFPTSYIPTTGSTVTRAADVASMTGTNFSSWYRQDEGTVFCQGISNSLSNSSYWTLSNSGSDGVAVLVYPDNNLTYQVVDGGSIQVNNQSFATYPAVASVKTAAAIKLNNFAVVANGGTITSDTSGTVPAVTSFVIGNYLGGGTSYDYSGTIARLTYYPKRLPDATLQLLTR